MILARLFQFNIVLLLNKDMFDLNNYVTWHEVNLRLLTEKRN